MLNEKSSSYLFELILYNTPAIHVRHTHYKNSFFPFTVSKWNKFEWKSRNSRSLSILKKYLLNIIGPFSNSIFDVHSPYGIKLLTRLHLGLRHLRDHKFRHCFYDNLNPICECGHDTETITQFFLHYASVHTPRKTLLSNIRKINEQILCYGKD